MSRDNIDAVPAQQIALEFEHYRVSALLDQPPPPERAKLLLVLAHGAGDELALAVERWAAGAVG